MGRAVGKVDADNNDGSEDMQVQVYCACLPDSVFIYCLDRRLCAEAANAKHATRTETMTLTVENPTPGYVVRCNCCAEAPHAVFCRRRAQPPLHACRKRRMQPNTPAPWPGLPRLILDSVVP